MPGVTRIADFDVWREGFDGAVVHVYLPYTTTHAAIFYDEDLSQSAANPQTLITRVDQDGRRFGKWGQPIYVGTAYQLNEPGLLQSGVIRPPLTGLAGQDASAATVATVAGGADNTLASIIGRTIYAADFGAFSPTSIASNTAVLVAAIGRCAELGGGEVVLPAGEIAVNQIDLPGRVVLTGAGRDVTTLRSQVGDVVVHISGPQAGLRSMTLDGVQLTAGSIGVKAVGKSGIVFDGAKIMRFEHGFEGLGVSDSQWNDFVVSDCDVGAILRGDTAEGTDEIGGPTHGITWSGGIVDLMRTTGLDIAYKDAECHGIDVAAVTFGSVVTDVKITGARRISMRSCRWTQAGKYLDVLDDDTANAIWNTVAQLLFDGCEFGAGKINITDLAELIEFRQSLFNDTTVKLEIPITNAITVRDCIESDGFSLDAAGDGRRWQRVTSRLDGAVSAITTGATALAAWSHYLEAGTVAYVTARIVANQRNGIGRAIYDLRAGVYRPGDTLAYDAQTANFGLGQVLTGATSGAKAVIIADSDSGTTGTLTLRSIVGKFVNDELITDPLGGSASANGTLTAQAAALDAVGVSVLRTSYETDAAWNATIAANGQQVEVQVTGAASKDIQWLVDVHVSEV